MNKNNILPLKDRAHFRRIREVISEIAKCENINILNYDLCDIQAYDTMGENLKGKNVSYNTEGNYSCWVGNNNYEMFEVPAKGNRKKSPYGDFLFLAINKNYDYYLFGSMVVALDEYQSTMLHSVIETVCYKPYGKYSIVFTDSENYIVQQEYGYKFIPGVRSDEHNFSYDSYNTRKKYGYNTSEHEILESLGVNNLKTNKLVSSDAVPIYKHNKPKK